MQPPLIVIDEEFLLDRWRRSDGHALRRFDLDAETARFFGWTVADARALPDSHYDGPARERTNLEEWERGERLNLAIRRRRDGEAVGWVELRSAGSDCEVSYMVAAEMRGQQLAPRALDAYLAWATGALALRRVTLVCHTENRASQRVAEKCGFTLCGQHGEEFRYERQLSPT